MVTERTRKKFKPTDGATEPISPSNQNGVVRNVLKSKNTSSFESYKEAEKSALAEKTVGKSEKGDLQKTLNPKKTGDLQKPNKQKTPASKNGVDARLYLDENSTKATSGPSDEFKFGLPEGTRFVVVDVGPKRKPVLPTKEMTTMHTVAFEPGVEFASAIKNFYPRLRVISAAVGNTYGLREFNYSGVPESRNPHFGNLIRSQTPQEETTRFVAPLVPMSAVLKWLPEDVEVFVRVSNICFELSEAQDTAVALRRVSLFKKEIPASSHTKEDIRRWNDFMKGIGFEPIKIEKSCEEKKEIVWINKSFKTGEKSTVLLKDTDNLPSSEKNKLEKIKNSIRFSFDSPFFDIDTVKITIGRDVKLLSREKALWRIILNEDPDPPKDAFRVDLESTPGKPKKTVLLAHAYFRGGLHCGHCELSKPNETVFCWSKYQLITSDFQMLCGSDFEWKEAPKSELPDCAVVGGRDNTGDNLFIARVKVDGKTYVGKACRTWLVNEGTERRLKCQYYDKETRFAGSFDVLVYCGEEKWIV